MFRKTDPQWSSLVEQWKKTQHDLRTRIIVAPLDPLPRFIAGADAAFSTNKNTVFSAAVVYDREKKQIIEVAHAHCDVMLPYVPGFLSFREGPAVLQALGRLKHPFGAICFDGHGYAHPRRCGLASHMSITVDVPGVGVAKSRFIGTYDEPGSRKGCSSPLMDEGEQIGLVLRTQTAVRPIFISIGHRVDLESAAKLALACTTRFRIPEPTRQADIEVTKLKRQYEKAQS
jgi:deoxyribonuclease V